MHDLTTSIAAGTRAPRTTGRVRRRPSTSSHAVALRVALVAGCVVAIGLACLSSAPSTVSQVDPGLALLLRGMAAIKSAMAAATIALLAWRLGRPVTTRIAASYVVGAWLVTGATTMIWQLASIVPAALVFHLGLMLLLVAAWRDEASPWSLGSARRRPGRGAAEPGRRGTDPGLAPR